jgi:hypothetical protein
MHFDYIIGNPPYSDRTNADCGGKGGGANNLDSDIYEKSREYADHVSFIIRAKHFIREPCNFRRVLFSSGNLKEIKFVHPSNFPMVQNTQTCIVTWDANHQGPCAVTYNDGEVIDRVLTRDTLIKLNNKEFELEVPNNMKHRHLYGKIMRYTIEDKEGGVPLVEIMGKRGEPPTMRYVDEALTDRGYGKHGVVMNYNATWTSMGKMCAKEPEWRISGSIVMLETSSKEESERLIEYLESKPVTDAVKKIKRSFANSKYVFALIPDCVL